MQNTAIVEEAFAEATEADVTISNFSDYPAERKLSFEEQVELVKVLTTPRPLTDTMKKALTKELERQYMSKNARL